MRTKNLNLAVVICIIFVAFVQNAKAQFPAYGDTMTGIGHPYDTLIIYRPPYISNCDMSFDIIPCDASYYCRDMTDEHYVNDWQEDTNPLQFDENGYVTNMPFKVNGGILNSNSYRPEGFAQYWHFDSVVYICGVAARMGGDNRDTTQRFRLFDTKFTQIRQSNNFISLEHAYDRCVTYRYFFLYNWDDIPEMQSFYIAGDEITNGGYYVSYSHSRSIFDTIWRDTLIGCQMPFSPYFKKDGVWKSFAEDSIYQFYQKCFIEMYPILLIRHDSTDTSSLADEITDKHLNVYPNPANDIVYIQSGFRIISVEVLDINGNIVKKEEPDTNETELVISSLQPGSYILKITTPRGYCNRKIIKQ